MSRDAVGQGTTVQMVIRNLKNGSLFGCAQDLCTKKTHIVQ